MKIHIHAFGLSLGIVFSIISVFYAVAVLLGLLSIELVEFINEFFIFKIQTLRSIPLNVLEHFVFGYLSGTGFAWIYNKLTFLKIS